MRRLATVLFVLLFLPTCTDSSGPAPSVTSVEVTPASSSLVVGETRQLSASARDEDGAILPDRPVTWTSSVQSVATVDQSGLVTTVASGGPVTITATSEGISGTATVTVLPIPVASVEVTPVESTVVVGETVQLTAITRDSDGNVLPLRPVTWNSSAQSVATVDDSGLVTTVAPGGPVTITVTSEGISGNAVVTVLPLFSLSTVSDPPNGGVTAGDGTFVSGETVSVSATPNAGYEFESWTANGALASEEASFQFPLAADQVITAHFSVANDAGNWTSGGTYSDWVFPEGAYESIEWTYVATAEPSEALGQENLIHYYAYNFSVTNATLGGGGYAGFQTVQGALPKRINYAIWNSNGGRTEDGVLVDNYESEGPSVWLPYPWQVGRAYRFQLKEGPSGIDDQGKWWGLWVTDVAAGETSFVGELRFPAIQDGKDTSKLIDRTSFFGEDTHWWRALSGNVHYVCSDFEGSSLAVMDVTANETVRPVAVNSFTNSGDRVDWTNGWVTYCCHVTIYTNDTYDVQHNLGFWPTPPENIIGGG